MKTLHFYVLFLLPLVILFSCNKDEGLVQSNYSGHNSNLSPASSYSDQHWIQVVQDSIQMSVFDNLSQEAGTPVWECAHVEHLNGGVVKIVVPFISGIIGDIENLLIAFRSDQDKWRVKIINKYHLDLLLQTSDFIANKLVYTAFLKEFVNMDSICNFQTSVVENLENRVENDIIIVFDDGTKWFLDATGKITVLSGGGGSGCFNTNSGTIYWPNGTSYRFPGANSNGNSGNNSDDNTSNFNSNEFSFGCSWCTNPTIFNNGGGTFSNVPSCQTSSFWQSYPPIVKKEYIKALSEMINQTDIILCSDPNLTIAEQAVCIDNETILCLGVMNGCIQLENGHLNQNNFTDCMGAVLHVIPCLEEATNFINKYDLNLTIFELEQLAGGFGNNCGNQADFDKSTLTSLINNDAWLNNLVNLEIKLHIYSFLSEHSEDTEALFHAYSQIQNMKNDAQYKAFVVSSFTWSPIMWSIAKELVGDKAVDVMINLIPGFGNADELRDAIKAAKNGDWIEFTFEIGKIVGQNTPWGKILKIGEAGSEMYQFYSKVEKIMDKISGYSTAVIEQMWNIVKTLPPPMRIDSDIVSGFCKAINRGLKNIDDIVSHANVTYIDNSTISHIFRGSNNGGVHHISALVADPNTYKIHNRVPTSNGCYKATIYKNGVPMTPDKDFFPDDWDENQVVDAIKGAWLNKVERFDLSSNSWVGTASNGQKIRMYISNNKIISAFPYHGN